LDDGHHEHGLRGEFSRSSTLLNIDLTCLRIAIDGRYYDFA